ncbi:MAG: hypothetical protein ACI87N_003499 [Flavobacteriales bacterium]|jgi:hypothetical protein
MAVEINQVYKTSTGLFIRVVSVKESGFHHFIEVRDNVNQVPVPEIRNRSGHVTHRVNLVYSEEVISTFAKMKAL